MGLKVYLVLACLCRDGDKRMVKCKVCSKIEGKDKLLVLKLDYFIKHLSLTKCNVAQPRVINGAYYVNLNNAHVKNEKQYVCTRCDMIVNLVEAFLATMLHYSKFNSILHIE